MKQEASRLERTTAVGFDRTGFQDLWACVHEIPKISGAHKSFSVKIEAGQSPDAGRLLLCRQTTSSRYEYSY